MEQQVPSDQGPDEDRHCHGEAAAVRDRLGMDLPGSGMIEEVDLPGETDHERGQSEGGDERREEEGEEKPGHTPSAPLMSVFMTRTALPTAFSQGMPL